MKKLTFSLEQYSAAKATELDTKMKEAIAEDEARLLRLQARCKNVCYFMSLLLLAPLLKLPRRHPRLMIYLKRFQ